MQKAEIESEVMEQVSLASGIAVEDIKQEQLLADDLALDSLDLIELTLSLEDKFDIDIPDNDVERLQTPRDVIEYVAEKKGV